MSSQSEEKNKEAVKALAEELGVSEEAVSEFHNGDDERTRKFFKDLSESSKFPTNFRKKNDKDENLNEGDKEHVSLFDKKDGDALMESLS
jgi:hypothetical protein